MWDLQSTDRDVGRSASATWASSTSRARTEEVVEAVDGLPTRAGPNREMEGGGEFRAAATGGEYTVPSIVGWRLGAGECIELRAEEM